MTRRPTLPFFSTIKSCVWLAMVGLGTIGAAHQLANMAMLANFLGAVWCVGLAASAAFVAMATIGMLKARHLGWFVWACVPVFAVVGVILTGGQWFSIGPICFGGSEVLRGAAGGI